MIFGICGIWFGEVNLAISPWSFIWAIILSGFGSGMVFVPLSTTTVAGLTNQEMGNATGLYNLLRNVGGSVGISITDTLLARHSQLHQANLVQNLTPSGRIYQEQLSHGINQLGPKIGTAMADAGALGRIYGSLNVQALLLSYVDDFRYLALASFACLPVVFLLRKAGRQKRRHHARGIKQFAAILQGKQHCDPERSWSRVVVPLNPPQPAKTVQLLQPSASESCAA